MIGYGAKEDCYIAESTDNIDEINRYEGAKLYLYDTKEWKISHIGQWVNYVAPVGNSGGGTGVIENGSITTEMFASDAKAPLAVTADKVASSGITDATATGKALIVATDATTARTAIGAGTSSLAVGSTVGSALSTTASAGTSAQASRADHVHPYPTPANIGASPTSHTHTIANVTNLQTSLDAKITATKGVAVADSTATDVAGLVANFNSLLASLRTAGIIAN